MAIWQDILSKFPYEVGQEAVNVYLFAGNKWFPTIAEFAKLCDEVWVKRSQQPPKVIAIEDQKARDRASKSMSKRCTELVTRKMNKEIGLPEYIEELKKLDKDFPGVGFDRSAMELSQ